MLGVLFMYRDGETMEKLEHSWEQAYKKKDTRSRADTSAIRVDNDTYERLKVMAGNMSVAGFLRAFSNGTLDMGNVPGYASPVSGRLQRLEHLVEGIDSTMTYILREIRSGVIDKDS
jgi:predicted DNA-binding protein